MSIHPLGKDEQHNGRDIILYDRYASNIFTYLSRRLTNPQDAEDVLLEVFIAALKHVPLADLPPEQQLAWLQRVAHDKVIDRYRQQHTQTTLLSMEQVIDIVDEALTPEQQIIRQEVYIHLYKALRALPPKQQQVVQLRYGNNMRFKESAALLNTTDSTVRKLLFRTLQSLRTAYDQH